MRRVWMMTMVQEALLSQRGQRCFVPVSFNSIRYLDRSLLLPACLRAAQPCPYCFTQWSKNGFFAPQRRHVAPINVIFGRPAVRSPMPNCTFIGAEMWGYSLKTGKIWNFGHKFAPRATSLHCFYEIISVCTRRWVAFEILVWSLSEDKEPSYKHLSSVGAFSHKFSIAPSGETTDRRGTIMVRTSSITMPSMVGIVDEKV